MKHWAWKRWVAPLGLIALVAGAWRAWGGAGVALAVGGVVMWGLLHFTRLAAVLQRAARRPVGTVDSAVMLSARLCRGHSLLHVLALTRSLGQPSASTGGAQEVYRWCDAGAVCVQCEFNDGKLTAWTLERPPSEPATGDAGT